MASVQTVSINKKFTVSMHITGSHFRTVWDFVPVMQSVLLDLEKWQLNLELLSRNPQE